MRSESVRKGGSKSRSACCRYIVYLEGLSMAHDCERLGLEFVMELMGQS